MAIAATAAVAVFLSARSAPPGQSGTRASGTAFPFDLENVRPGGPNVSLWALRGRPVVVNFWASWCVPCRREMPAFQAVFEEVGERVAFVGVNVQDSRKAALGLLAETGVRYPSGYDPKGEVSAAYGLFGMPTTVFVSPRGEVVERKTGEMSRGELEDAVGRLG